MAQTYEGWVAVIGALAAACTTLAFVPQITRIRRQGGRDVSYGLFGIYLAWLLPWLSYGLLIGARAVIAANVASAVLVCTAIVLKARSEPLRTAATSPPRRLRIAIDMDDVIADFRAEEQRVCDEALGERLGGSRPHSSTRLLRRPRRHRRQPRSRA